MLRYHARSFELLGIQPCISASATDALARVEETIGRALPASIREWYAQQDACRLLLEYSNGDPPLDIVQLGEPLCDTHGGGPHDLLLRDLLPFRFENQGVCVWAVQLNGSEDPPVVVDRDTQFKIWQPCASSFSEHVYTCVWDYALVLLRDLLIQAQHGPVSREALAFLKEHFVPGPVTTGWPGDTQYRFSRGDQRILIWSTGKSADWWLAADSEDSLRELASTVGSCDQVNKSFWSNSEQGERVLTRL